MEAGKDDMHIVVKFLLYDVHHFLTIRDLLHW